MLVTVKFKTCINELIADLVELVEPLLIAPRVLEVVVVGRFVNDASKVSDFAGPR